MKKFLDGVLFLILIMNFSCGNGNKATDNEVEFKKFTGEIIGPEAEYGFGNFKLPYNIDWPIKGDGELVNTLRSWIVDQISEGEATYSEGDSIEVIVNTIAERFFEKAKVEGDVYMQTIDISAEMNTPFDGYITLFSNTYPSQYTPGRYSTETFNDITIRLSDKKQFDPETAIGDKEKLRKVIILKARETWDDEIMNCYVYDIPEPTEPLSLTKDGVKVKYSPHVLVNTMDYASYTIPYSDITPALSQEALSFLGLVTTNKESNNDGSADGIPELEENYAKYAIKEANIHNSDFLSSDFRNLWDKVDAKKEWVLLGFGFGIDVVDVKEPLIKILKVITNTEGKEAFVIFDFRDKYGADMGWAGESEYSPKICAVNFKYEDDQWVVDDFFQEVGLGRADADKFNKDNAESTKANIKGMIE